jgi:hypothetical protein
MVSKRYSLQVTKEVLQFGIRALQLTSNKGGVTVWYQSQGFDAEPRWAR